MRKWYGFNTLTTFEEIVNKIFEDNIKWNNLDIAVDIRNIASLTYEYTEKFGYSGGSSGTQAFTVETIVGSTSEEAISEATSLAISSTIEFSSDLSPIEASLEISAQYDFSSASFDARSESRTEIDDLQIDLSAPCYVY